LHGPVDERTFEILRSANAEFAHWYQTWDQSFSQKYEDATFYRQSLQIQQLHAELYHSATGLRGINGPEDVSKMPNSQREVAIKSIQIARQILDMTVNSPSYREGMKYAVHYTHATATFAASFLLRLARLFPNECNVTEIRERVETLASLMSEIPGKRYALTLQLMLKRSMKRKSGTSRSQNFHVNHISPKSNARQAWPSTRWSIRHLLPCTTRLLVRWFRRKAFLCTRPRILATLPMQSIFGVDLRPPRRSNSPCGFPIKAWAAINFLRVALTHSYCPQIIFPQRRRSGRFYDIPYDLLALSLVPLLYSVVEKNCVS